MVRALLAIRNHIVRLCPPRNAVDLAANLDRRLGLREVLNAESNYPQLLNGRLSLEFDRHVAAIAERLVLRCAAPANGHSVADFVVVAVSRGECDAAAQPNRPAAIFHGIFDQADRDRQFLLYRFAGGLVEGDEATRRTMMHLAKEHRTDARIVGARYLVPDFAIRVAEPGVGAEVPRVQKSENRTIEYRHLLRTGRTGGRFSTVKADLGMSTVAELRLMGVAA